MRLDISNKSIAVGAPGTTSMMGKKKTCLTAGGKGNGLGGKSVLFGFVQFAVWENLFERNGSKPRDSSRGFFCLCFDKFLVIIKIWSVQEIMKN